MVNQNREAVNDRATDAPSACREIPSSSDFQNDWREIRNLVAVAEQRISHIIGFIDGYQAALRARGSKWMSQ